MSRDAEKERLKQIAHVAGYHQYEEDENTPWPTDKLSEQDAEKKKADDKKAADKKGNDKKKSDDDDDNDDNDEDEDDEEDDDDNGDDDNGEDDKNGDDKDKKKAPPFPPKKKTDKKKKTEARGLRGPVKNTAETDRVTSEIKKGLRGVLDWNQAFKSGPLMWLGDPATQPGAYGIRYARSTDPKGYATTIRIEKIESGMGRGNWLVTVLPYGKDKYTVGKEQQATPDADDAVRTFVRAVSTFERNYQAMAARGKLPRRESEEPTGGEPLQEERKHTLYALYIGDGALVGAAGEDDLRYADSESFWPMEWRENDDWAIVELRGVPEALARELMAMGTSGQIHRDGYDAANDAARYQGDVLDYGDNVDPMFKESAPSGDEPLHESKKLTEMPRDWKKRVAESKKLAADAKTRGTAALERGAEAYEDAAGGQHRDNDGSYAEYNIKLDKVSTPDWVNDLLDDPHGEWAWDTLMNSAQWELENLPMDLESHWKVELYGDKKVYTTGRSGGWLMVPVDVGGLNDTLNDLEKSIDYLDTELSDMDKIKPGDYEDGEKDEDFEADIEEALRLVDDAVDEVDEYAESVEESVVNIERLNKAMDEITKGVQKYWSSEEYWSEAVEMSFGNELPQMILAAVEDERIELTDLPDDLRKIAAGK
jgi:hypothetical protein